MEIAEYRAPSFKEKISSKLSFLKDIHSMFYYVLFLIGAGLLFFGYALVTQKFTTPYSGDFSQQSYQLYYNFYDDWWTFFKTGQFPAYDANTFMGADNIMSNTYYGLFSPFTITLLFFPRNLIPQAMSLVSIARLVVGGLFFRLYLKYLGVSEKTARLFSFAYAFVGWIAYYLWFNPFYEVLTFFPLILYGIEKVIKERKLWAVSLGYFLLGICNYFFLLTMGIFGVLYAGFRYFQTIKTRNLKENLLVILYGFLGFAFGMGMAMFCVFPAIISSFSINRATQGKYFEVLKQALLDKDFKYFFKIFFKCWSANVTNYGNEMEQYYYSFYFPLVSYFYPPFSNRYVNLIHINSFENTGSSMFIYTPCIILMGVALFRSGKNKKISHFIAFTALFVALFIPFFYFLCGAFVTAYGRWEIVVAVPAITYVAINFDHREEVPWYVVLISGALAFGLMLYTYFISLKAVSKFTNTSPLGKLIWIVIYELVICAVETGLLAGFWKKKYLHIIVNCMFASEIAVVGTLISLYHSLQNIRTSVAGGFNNVPAETKVFDSINSQDDSFFRVQFSRTYDGNTNLGMIEKFNGVSTFHSFYNNNLDDFLRWSQIMSGDTGWSGNACWKRTNLDEFIGVKYYVSKDSETTFNFHNSTGDYKITYEPNIPLGYERIDNDDDGYRIYKNKYQINLGTSYDLIYFKNECDDGIHNSFYPITSSTNYVLRNEEAYFKGVILDNDDVFDVMQKYGDAFTYEHHSPTQDAKNFQIKLQGYYRNVDNKYFDPSNPDRDLESPVTADQVKDNCKNVQMVFVPRTGTFPHSPEGTYFAFNYPVRNSSNNYNATVYLIGEDEHGKSKVITFDNGRANARNSARSIRGLYSKEQVKMIIVCIDGNKYSSTPALSYEPFEDCIARYEKAMSYQLGNVKYNVNKFTFETHYSTPRFVVTQLAYTGGWRVFTKDASGKKTQLKVYNSMGGFAGFVAPAGDASYYMDYLTERFPTGLTISLVSLLGATTATVVPITINKKKREN